MRTMRTGKSVVLHAFAMIYVAMSAPQSHAQSIAASGDSFDYYHCNKKLPEQDVNGIYNAVRIAVKSYNSKPSVDVKMPEPNIHECYIQIGKNGSLFSGASSVEFFTSTQHFRCSVAGNCSGDLAGYDASAMAMPNGIQLHADTGRWEDSVYLCVRNGEISGERC